MTGYWDTVPKGIWKISDPIDVLNALRDRETTWVLDKSHNRINLFGTRAKALILDLKEVKNWEEIYYREVVYILGESFIRSSTSG